MMSEIISHAISLSGFAISNQGGRKENQDDWGYADTPLGFLLVICDGMGGGPGGKTASGIVKKELISSLMSSSPQNSRVDAIKKAVSQANDALDYEATQNPSLKGMGSTMVAILINDQSAIVAHLGDSRCYRISKGKIAFRTIDHSLVGELVQNKAMTEEQARLSPQSNVITRGLGCTDNHVCDIKEVQYKRGDRFVLCTDGVWGIMPHNQLISRLTSQQDVGSLVNNLSSEVDKIGMDSGGDYDNHTLAIIEIKDAPLHQNGFNKYLNIILIAALILLSISIIVNIVCGYNLKDYRKKEQTIKLLESENQSLERNLALYKNIKNNDTKDLLTQIFSMQSENEYLKERQASHLFKIDSLERIISKMQHQSEKAKSDKKKLQPQGKSSANEIVSQIISLFKNMEEAKGATWQEAAGKKAKFRLQIIEQLQSLNIKTDGKYKSTIDAVKRELEHKDHLTEKVAININNKTKEEYVSTGVAAKKIKELSAKVQAIGKQLNK